jgi:hypothetical protein
VLEGGILGIGEPVVRVPLQRRNLPDQRREVAGYVLVTSFGSCGPIYEPNTLRQEDGTTRTLPLRPSAQARRSPIIVFPYWFPS